MKRFINWLGWHLAAALGWEGSKLPTPQAASASRALRHPLYFCGMCKTIRHDFTDSADRIVLTCGHVLHFDPDTGIWE